MTANDISTPLAVARDYIGRGWSPVPIPYQEKGPTIAAWQNLRVTEQSAAQYFGGAPMNVGVILGSPSQGLTDIDLDCDEAVALAPYVLPRSSAIFGRASRPASHWLYQTNLAEHATKATRPFRDPAGGMLVELRVGGAKGAQTVFPGSTHVSGEAITWVESGEAPGVDGEDLQQRVGVLAACCLLSRYWPEEGNRHDAALVLGGVFSRAGISSSLASQLVEAIARVSGDLEPRDRGKAARDAAEAHRRGEMAYGLTRLQQTFDVKIASCVADWIGYREARAEFVGRDQPSAGEAEPRTPAFSDEATALSFAARHADDLRYVASRGKWFNYTGTCWKIDNTMSAVDLIRDECRAAAQPCNEPRIARQLASAKTAAAVERLAKADRRLAATNEQWDADPWLLNTPTGVVDLKTGRLRPHAATDYMTKTVAVSPGGDCPKWKEHLLRIMNGDEHLVAYLQRVFGYCLTGLTSEHALFFAHGTGANGKSVTLNTVAGILADYHRSAPIETFTASQTERHPTELAGLQGARIVTATETEEGRAFAEARIKTLTGGDRIAARFMRQDFFEFTPQFKLVIAGNHKPTLRNVDEAIRRRLHMIPFTVTIPVDQRDHELTEKLKEEWSGILAWMIEGCLQWQHNGLNPPEAVRSATAEYLANEDTILGWIAEACVRDPQSRERSTVLYASYLNWAKQRGEYAGSQKSFSQRLQNHGFNQVRTNKGSQFIGLRLSVEDQGTGLLKAA